jgi:hypothetical protein
VEKYEVVCSDAACNGVGQFIVMRHVMVWVSL